MPVKFTNHALHRMEERGITVAEVYRLLAYGAYNNRFGSFVWHAVLRRIKDEHWRSALKNLRVICDPNDFTVLTVFHKDEEQPYYRISW